MKCAICGKEKILAYISIYLKHGACIECYDKAKEINEYMKKVLPVDSYAGEYTVRRLDESGKELYRKHYKNGHWKRFVRNETRKLFNVNMQE